MVSITIKMVKLRELVASPVEKDNTLHLKFQYVNHVLLVSTNLLPPPNTRVPFVHKVHFM